MTTTIDHGNDVLSHNDVMSNSTNNPDPEVLERARGPRRFTAAYKARILAEYDNLDRTEKGEAR